MFTKFEKISRAVLEVLPTYAEEGGEYTEVTIDELLTDIQLIAKISVDESEVKMGLECILALLANLSLLDQSSLSNERVKLVSFPAWLVAKSVLSILSDSDQSLFTQTFWSIDNAPCQRIEEQRAFLRNLEIKRQQNHARNMAKPLRFIHVAWGIIKLDGKILLHRREDIKERVEKESGNYVLVGGRTNTEDLRKVRPEKDPLEIINLPKASEMIQAAPFTLKRELLEEVGLDYQKEHFTYEDWLTLAPYEQVQGARSNHALSRYHIQIFFIRLTPAGYFHLMENAPRGEQFLWFSSEEVEKGQKITGQTAYLTALHNDFRRTGKDLVHELDILEDSSTETKVGDIHDGNVLELSSSFQKMCSYGQIGKGKSIDLGLLEETHGLLLLLAAHRKSMQIEPRGAEEIILLNRGWVKLIDSNALSAGRRLLELCQDYDYGFSIENLNQFYFRVSLSPECIFFAPDFYSYNINKTLNLAGKMEFTIKRRAIHTLFSRIHSASATTEVTEILVNNIEKKQKGLKDNYRKSKVRDVVRDLGLRDFVVRDGDILIDQ